jgi:hypothetical protein
MRKADLGRDGVEHLPWNVGLRAKRGANPTYGGGASGEFDLGDIDLGLDA